MLPSLFINKRLDSSMVAEGKVMTRKIQTMAGNVQYR